MESDKHTRNHHIQERSLKDKHKTQITEQEPQKAPPWNVSKKITGGLKHVSRYQLTLKNEALKSDSISTEDQSPLKGYFGKQ